jgi:hypothetical protein
MTRRRPGKGLVCWGISVEGATHLKGVICLGTWHQEIALLSYKGSSSVISASNIQTASRANLSHVRLALLEGACVCTANCCNKHCRKKRPGP